MIRILEEIFEDDGKRETNTVAIGDWKSVFGDKSYRNTVVPHVHSCQQKSIGLKFSKSPTGSDVQYSCHHNSSRFTFPIFAHSCRFSVLHSLQSITPRIY